MQFVSAHLALPHSEDIHLGVLNFPSVDWSPEWECKHWSTWKGQEKCNYGNYLFNKCQQTIAYKADFYTGCIICNLSMIQSTWSSLTKKEKKNEEKTLSTDNSAVEFDS